jgi:hypothetical protein
MLVTTFSTQIMHNQLVFIFNPIIANMRERIKKLFSFSPVRIIVFSSDPLMFFYLTRSPDCFTIFTAQFRPIDINPLISRFKSYNIFVSIFKELTLAKGIPLGKSIS